MRSAPPASRPSSTRCCSKPSQRSPASSAGRTTPATTQPDRHRSRRSPSKPAGTSTSNAADSCANSVAAHTESDLYPRTKQVTALITAGLTARRHVAPASRPGQLLDPLTAAEIRVLEKLPEGLTYTEMASELYLSLNT